MPGRPKSDSCLRISKRTGEVQDRKVWVALRSADQTFAQAIVNSCKALRKKKSGRTIVTRKPRHRLRRSPATDELQETANFYVSALWSSASNTHRALPLYYCVNLSEPKQVFPRTVGAFPGFSISESLSAEDMVRFCRASESPLAVLHLNFAVKPPEMCGSGFSAWICWIGTNCVIQSKRRWTNFIGFVWCGGRPEEKQKKSLLDAISNPPNLQRKQRPNGRGRNWGRSLSLIAYRSDKIFVPAQNNEARLSWPLWNRAGTAESVRCPGSELCEFLAGGGPLSFSSLQIDSCALESEGVQRSRSYLWHSVSGPAAVLSSSSELEDIYVFGCNFAIYRLTASSAGSPSDSPPDSLSDSLYHSLLAIQPRPSCNFIMS